MIDRRLFLFLIASLLLHSLILMSLTRHVKFTPAPLIEVRLQYFPATTPKGVFVKTEKVLIKGTKDTPVAPIEPVPIKTALKSVLPEPSPPQEMPAQSQDNYAISQPMQSEFMSQPASVDTFPALFARAKKVNFLVKQQNLYLADTRMKIRHILLAATESERREQLVTFECEMEFEFSTGARPNLRCRNSILEKKLAALNWESVQKPQAFSLPYKRLQVHVSFSAYDFVIGLMPGY